MLSADGYHRRTSYDRSAMSGHGLDWSDQPDVFKTYPGLPTVPLPESGDLSGPFLSELTLSHGQDVPVEMDLEWLAQVIWMTHAVTARARHGSGDFYYRNVASAGALYPFELYVGAKGVMGVDDGLYHHTLGLNALTLLRRGDVSPCLSQIFEPERPACAMIAFFFSAIFYRSAWKYRDRAYRYHLLDTGHMVENFVLALAAQHAPVSLVYDFDDKKMNHLLGVDPQREGCLAMGLVQGKDKGEMKESQELTSLPPDTEGASRVSSRESDLSLIREIHEASSVVDGAGFFDSTGQASSQKGFRGENVFSSNECRWPEKMDYSRAVLERRSKRNFVPRQLSGEACDSLMSLLCFQADDGPSDISWTARQALSVGFLCGHVSDRDPGFYLLDPEAQTLSLDVPGEMLADMAHICLDQAWLANSAVHIVFLSDLGLLEKTWGPRGYRYAMMTAGRLGQRLYLGATAMGLGCCGIGAFYDDEARQLLGLGKAEKLLYLVALGLVKR